ncbi:MAG TPA: SulP family inorganic anion transporter, partial [Planctomycetota bacterium]|nr:SulP family inorganic anion transporter [Planctomycetota bacterium]
LPAGLPALGLPAVRPEDWNELLPLAAACFLLGAVESVAIGRMFAARTRTRLDANRELFALSVANLAAGLGRGYPVSGGMSQSLVNQGAGARTPLSTLFAALLVLLATLFLSGLLRDLPQPVLAAVVLTAVLGLIQPAAFVHLWRGNRYEFVAAFAALNGVLASGLLRGVLIGALISIVMLLHRASRPHVAFLGRIPGSRRFSDHERHPDNELLPGVVVFRPESSILYFNAEHVRDEVLEHVERAVVPPHDVVGDLSAAPHVDLSGAQMLSALCDELAERGVRLRLVEARASVRDILRFEGVDAKVGSVNRFETVADAVDDALAAGVSGLRS